MRIVSYFGDWTCECGRQNRLWDTCKCQKAGPCRDWVRGRCKYGDECRYAKGTRNFALPLQQSNRASVECLLGVTLLVASMS